MAPTLRDTNPVTTPRWLAACLVLIPLLLVISGAWLQHRLGNGGQSSATTAGTAAPTHSLELPADRCPTPRADEALHITVFGAAAPGAPMPARCLTLKRRTP